MLARSGCAPWFWLALFGFGVKAGFFPLHVWLPSAHANAPSHVSAMLSGAALKMGVYGIARFGSWLPAPAGAGWAVLGLGALSAVVGIAFALAQNDLKRLLAYCSVEHVGVILVGLGGALLALGSGSPEWGRLALAGALLHVWGHGAFKSLLFFGSGSVLHATGTREMSRLGGLWRKMPWTAGAFALGAVAVSGLPPLNGFVSEFLEYLGLLGAAAGSNPSRWAVLPAVIFLALAGGLALAAFLKACAIVFLGSPRTKTASEAHECGPRMLGPMLVLGCACLFLGLAPVAVWPALSRATHAWNPAWFPIAAPAPLRAVGAAHVTVFLLALVASAGLVRTVRVRGARRGPTWDCGYAAPSARMQYTSGSFAGIVSGWLGWLVPPERQVRRPRGTFPAEARRVERVPETVLERVIVPVGAAVVRTSLAARRLQHGRLQAYILYLVVGLTGLAILVLTGGVR